MKKHSINIEKKIDFIRKNKSLSAGMVEFYKKLFAAQEKAFDSLPAGLLDCFPGDIDSLPYIEADNIKLSGDVTSALVALMNELAEIVKSENPGMDFSSLNSSFGSIAGEALEKLLLGDSDYFTKKAGEFRIDISELLFMIHNVYKPLMVKARISADLNLKKEDWLEGDCPFCGYMPDFSKIVESRHSLRKLHCSLCEGEWEFPRLKCHTCGNDDQSTLGFFEYEDDPDYRVYYCDSCMSYIKSIRIPKLKEESGVDLAVEDVITGFLDSTMIGKNYNRS